MKTPKPKGLDGMNTPDQLTNIAKNKIMKEVGMSNLPIDDLMDAVVLVCEFVNDAVSGAGIMGYLDNIPLMVAAYSGSENILPQAADIDPAEKITIQNRVREKLNLSGDVENIVDRAINILYEGSQIYKDIQALKNSTG